MKDTLIPPCPTPGRRDLRLSRSRSDGERILFVAHSVGMGGAERSLCELVRGLILEGTNVAVAVPGHGPAVDDLRAAGASVFSYPLAPWGGASRDPMRFVVRASKTLLGTLRLLSIIRRWQPGVVVTNTITTAAGALAAALGGRPHIWHIREFGLRDHGFRFDLGDTLAWQLISRLSATVVTNSEAVARHVRKRATSVDVSVVYNAVNVDVVSHPRVVAAGRTLRLVIVGALTPGKGQQEAIHALAALPSYIEAHLTIVGDGLPGYRAYLQGLVQQLRLEDRVTFAGQASNCASHMAAADVLLVCSQAEAFGRVTVEAMKFGLPVIGSRSGGTTELVAHGRTGLLYSPGDHAELATCIIALYADRELGDRLGEDAREWATPRFTQERTSAAFRTVLDSVRSA